MQKSEIIEAITAGFHGASTEYLDWSANQNIHDAGIEFMATASIARELIKKGRSNDRNAWIYLEMPFRDIEYFSDIESKKRGRPRAILQGNPRVDIAYFENPDKIKGVIEVKRHLSFSNLSVDFERVCALVEKYGRPHGCLKFGCVVAIRPIKKSQIKTIDDVAIEVKQEFKERYDQKISLHVEEKFFSNESNVSYETFDTENDSEDMKKILGFGVVCFYISAE